MILRVLAPKERAPPNPLPSPSLLPSVGRHEHMINKEICEHFKIPKYNAAFNAKHWEHARKNQRRGTQCYDLVCGARGWGPGLWRLSQWACLIRCSCFPGPMLMETRLLTCVSVEQKKTFSLSTTTKKRPRSHGNQQPASLLDQPSVASRHPEGEGLLRISGPTKTPKRNGLYLSICTYSCRLLCNFSTI